MSLQYDISQIDVFSHLLLDLMLDILNRKFIGSLRNTPKKQTSSLKVFII